MPNAGGEGAALLVPGLLDQPCPIRFAISVQCAARVMEAQMRRDGAGRLQPAQHIAAEWVWMRLRPRYSQMPASGSKASRAASTPASPAAGTARLARPRQPAVEEHRHRRQDDAAIGVMLHLPRRRIADAHRRRCSIALEAGRDLLLHRVGGHDAVDRTDVLLPSDGEDEGDEILHGLGGAEAVQRLDHEIGVAQPAIAVIPVAPGCGASGIDVVCAAMMPPVSSKLLSLRVIAARMLASCHS